MPFYKDTPQNRRLGRVGKPYGKAAKPQRKPKKPFDYDPTADLERYYRAVEAAKKPKTQLADLGGVGDMADILKFLNPAEAKQLALTSKEMNRVVQKQPAGTFKRQPRKIKFEYQDFYFDDERGKLSNWKSLGLDKTELAIIKKAINQGEATFRVFLPQNPYMFYLLEIDGYTDMLIQRPSMRDLNELLPRYFEWDEDEPYEMFDEDIVKSLIKTNPRYKNGIDMDKFLDAIESPYRKPKPKPKPKPKKPLDMEGVD